MARVTVEDCVLKVPNRFDLVMLAAQRARSISSGAPLTLDRDNDKNPVVALREIADESIDLRALADGLVQSMQKHVEVDEPEEEPVYKVPGISNDDPTLRPDALAVDVAEQATEAGAEAEGEGDLAEEEAEAEALEAAADDVAEAETALAGDEDERA